VQAPVTTASNLWRLALAVTVLRKVAYAQQECIQGLPACSALQFAAAAAPGSTYVDPSLLAELFTTASY
jgi:hypothetical protein